MIDGENAPFRDDNQDQANNTIPCHDGRSDRDDGEE